MRDWSGFDGVGVKTITGILHTNVVVTDIHRSLVFYRDILGGNVFAGGTDRNEGAARAQGMTGTVDFEGHLLVYGETPMFVDLVQYSRPPVEGSPYPAANHTGISRMRLAVKDIERTHREWAGKGVDFLGAPREVPMFERTVRACLLRDPDGTFLELVEIVPPPVTGDKGLRLVPGVNQTVVVVSSLDSSLRFYRDALGGRQVAEAEGESESAGEMLGLGGRVRWREALLKYGFTNTLVHLVEYRSPPSTGTPYPRFTNVGIARICFSTGEIDRTHDALKALGIEFQTPPQVVNLLGVLMLKACYFRDPDGVLLQLVEMGELVS